MYFGTADYVLQYDGVSWRSVETKVGNFVTALASVNSTVYVGLNGDFGMLMPDEHGKLQYNSLAETIPEELNTFSAIKRILALGDTIVFQAEEKIFFFADDTITSVSPETTFHIAFVCQNKLYARERERGLVQFNGTDFEFIDGSDVFSDFGVFSILPYGNSKLVVTLELGLWEWSNNGFATIDLDDKCQHAVDEAGLIGGILLDDGSYAFNSLKGGMLIFDSNLNLVTTYSVNTGMPASEVLDVIQDSDGNLWIATQKGVSRIQYTSPFSFFDQAAGLLGNVNAATFYSNQVVVGTNEGLFVSNPQGAKVFAQVDRVSGSVWSIEQTPNGLWIATNNGLYFYTANGCKQINHDNLSGVLYIPENRWLLAAGISGVSIFDEPSHKGLLTLNDVKLDAYGIEYKHLANGSLEIWVGSKTSGVWQMNIDESMNRSYNYYSIEDGLPIDWVCPYKADEDILFATSRNGMLRFVYPEELTALMNDTVQDYSNLKGFFDIVDFPKHSSDKAVTAFCYHPDTSLVALDFQVNAIPMSDSIPNGNPFKTLDLGRINTISKDRQKNIVLIGADDGLVLVNRLDKKKRDYPIPTLALRGISIGLDSTLWYGDVPIDDRVFTVPYSLNSIKVDLASNYFDNEQTAQYAWRFKHSDDTLLTRWSSQNAISLSNLMEGEYQLVVVARNVYNQKSNRVLVNLRVLPPWYRTWWAYIAYAILAIAITYLVIQYNTRRLKEQNKRLEEIVKDRTREVVEQKEHIEHILTDIKASINYAQRIQQALLPSKEILNEYVPNHFIVFHPRDVVSGDFYWAAKVNNWFIITVADCTGHGVPGALMSMLGISFLNEIVRKNEVLSSAMVLNELRQSVIEALKQTGKQNEQKDGMDMSMVAFNIDSKECLWAGANNPLYLVRRGRPTGSDMIENCDRCRVHEFESNYIKEYKGDKMPVAIHTIMEDYTSHRIMLRKGDRLFLFSDGYADQFGGPEHRKFMAKNFKSLIARTSLLPIVEQGHEIDATFQQWKDFDGSDYEQIDDVTVLGFEV